MANCNRKRTQIAGVLLVPVLAVLLVAAPACIHKTGGQVTPWERVTTCNAVLAESIQTTTQGIIAAQQSGLLTVQQARPVLTYAANAATVHKQLSAVLGQTPSAGNLPQVQSLINQIVSGAQTLINDGSLGVKNPKSQQTFSADIQLITNTANSILAAYQAAVSGGAQ